MKTLLLALLLLSTPALALDLGPSGCSSGGVCLSPAPGVDWLTASDTYGRVTISIGGVLYDSGLYVVTKPVTNGFSGLVLVGPDGSTVTASASFNVYYTKGYRQMVRHVYLTAGSVN